MTSNHITELDQADSLADKRAEFEIPQDTIYLDGNSLGPLCRAARERVAEVVEQQWGVDLIQSWNKHAWIDLPLRTGEKIASIVGAEVGQIICCDSISVNLYKVLLSALQLNPGRHKVVSLQGNFPTDLYMVQGLQNIIGENKCQLHLTTPDKLIDMLDDSVAVLLLTQVDFRTGELLNMAEITNSAQQHGIKVIWDLAHSAGALEIELDACNVDFAVGCGYKYLNGGPGAPAFVYANKRLHSQFQQPLSGWMGHKAPFDFEPEYHAAEGIKQFLSGTPNILSLVALDAALGLFSDVSLRDIRLKSIALSELFLSLIDQAPELAGLRCVSPREPARRGSQLSFEHEQAYEICQALIARGVIGDFRAPNIIRFGFAPLYLSFSDVSKAVSILIELLSQGTDSLARYRARSAVT